MDNQKKIQRHDAILHIRETMSGCFGSQDGIFAGHDLDKERAKELRDFAAANDVTHVEVRDIALSYLYHKGFVPEHVAEQMAAVREFLKGHLN